MRLAAEQIRHILDTAHRRLGDDSTVLLFGSRADDEARGGDIDLLIETREPVGYWCRAQLLADLEKRIGQRVDLTFRRAGEPEKPIHRIARLTGVALS